MKQVWNRCDGAAPHCAPGANEPIDACRLPSGPAEGPSPKARAALNAAVDAALPSALMEVIDDARLEPEDSTIAALQAEFVRQTRALGELREESDATVKKDGRSSAHWLETSATALHFYEIAKKEGR